LHSAIDIQATFEKALLKLKPKLSDNKKELAAATLGSVALNYIGRRPKATEVAGTINPKAEETG